MKTNRNLRILIAAAIALAVSACYQITLVQQPHEALTNSTFKGKVVVKRTGASDNGIVQHVYGLFGICVPEGWQTTGDPVMTQVPKATTDVGDDEYKQTITRRMVASQAYTDLLNRDYPKTGYTWLGFATESAFKSLFNSGDGTNEVDSIYVEFEILTNDKTGVFYLDYMAGQTPHDKIDKLGQEEDSWNVNAATFKLSEYMDTHITVTRPDGTMDDNALTDPKLDPDWQLEPMKWSTRPGTAYAYKDKKYDGLFSRTRGWNGGDGVYTIGLPNGDVFWTFNDSFYGTVDGPTRARLDSNFPRNSVMVQRAHDGVPGENPEDFVWLADYINWTNPNDKYYFYCRTHIRHPQGDANIENQGGIDAPMVYWSGDGTVVDGKLQLFWIAQNSYELSYHGMSMATYSLDGTIPEGYYLDDIPDYLPKRGNYLCRLSTRHFLNRYEVPYGATLVEGDEGDDHTYLYATKDYHVVVARTETRNLTSPWQFYVKNADTGEWTWQDDYPDGDTMTASSIMANGYQGSMPWVFKEGDYYFMVMQAPIFSREVYIYRSTSPVGPFTDRRLLFLLPDHLDKIGETGYKWIYMVNLHPALSREGELVMSTNTEAPNLDWNHNDPGSADFYRPYFFRVYNWKNLYADLAGETAVPSLPTDSQQPAAASDAYYTLQGQRTQLPGKGIYIHRGKKVVMNR